MNYSLILEINKSINNNRDYAIINNTTANTKIINIFYQTGLLSGYNIHGRYLIIKIKTLYWKNWYITSKSINFINRLVPSKTGSIAAKTFIHVNKLKGDAFCNIISTDNGLISNTKKELFGGISLITAR